MLEMRECCTRKYHGHLREKRVYAAGSGGWVELEACTRRVLRFWPISGKRDIFLEVGSQIYTCCYSAFAIAKACLRCVLGLKACAAEARPISGKRDI